MNEFAAWLVPALGQALLHFLWQGALVGVLAWAALALLRNARPQARYAVACVALLACVLLPAWAVWQAIPGADASVGAAIATNVGQANATLASAAPRAALPAWFALSAQSLPWIVALWAIGVGLLSLRMACGLLWVRQLCREAMPDDAGRWQACLDRLAPRIGNARAVALRLVEHGDSPVTAGWWKPVVLLPVAVAARMPMEHVEALLAHELAHVRRCDYLVNLLQGAAEALLFYHPAVWWLSHRIRVERELVADDIAANALGEPRRLALALAELDCPRCPRLSFPPTHYAPAAHGGQLMTRIHRLIRPDRRTAGATVALPLLALATAGIAFYAHARMSAPEQAPLRVAAAPVANAQPLPAPATSPGAQVLVAANDGERGDTSYAIVRKDRDGLTLSGDLDDIDDVQAARRGIDGDFLWFRQDGKAWIVDDAEILARAEAAWREANATGEEMEAIERRLAPHTARMEEIAARMEAVEPEDESDRPEVRAATARMEALGERMETLAERQVALAARMVEDEGEDHARLASEQDRLAREQEALSREMEQHSATLHRMAERMEARHAPMEALAREMEEASRPLEAASAEMDAIGERLDRQTEVADGKVRALLREAVRSGRARPSSTQQ